MNWAHECLIKSAIGLQQLTQPTAAAPKSLGEAGADVGVSFLTHLIKSIGKKAPPAAAAPGSSSSLVASIIGDLGRKLVGQIKKGELEKIARRANWAVMMKRMMQPEFIPRDPRLAKNRLMKELITGKRPAPQALNVGGSTFTPEMSVRNIRDQMQEATRLNMANAAFNPLKVVQGIVRKRNLPPEESKVLFDKLWSKSRQHRLNLSGVPEDPMASIKGSLARQMAAQEEVARVKKMQKATMESASDKLMR